MLIVLIVLTIVFSIIFIKGALKDNEDMMSIGITGLAIFGIAMCVVGVIVGSMYCYGFPIKDKIVMYQEENTKIENEVSTIVENYKDYEKDTFTGLKTASPTTLVSLFPELKSNELVNKQIDIYLENNKKIKELKEKQIEMKLAKWLLYFGN